jgi:hypothetical protein
MPNTPRPTETATHTNRLAWVHPVLRPAGTLGDVLKGGNNKVSAVTGDPGEPQKIPGNDF